jgi:hypothetical protein
VHIDLLEGVHMDQHQLTKAMVEHTELEYQLNGQWVPVIIANSNNKHFLATGAHSQNITIQLLSVPPGHPGTVRLTDDDMKHRIRVKGSN